MLMIRSSLYLALMVALLAFLMTLTSCFRLPDYVTGAGIPRAEWTVPGVDLGLAEHRSAVISDLKYTVTLDLRDAGRTFMGSVFLDFARKAAREGGEIPAYVVLDFRGKAVRSLEVIGHESTYTWDDGHIIVESAGLSAPHCQILIDFESGIGAAGEGLIEVLDKDDGGRYLYTLNVPADCHALIPCFDQPDLKGRFSLTVEAPVDWEVIGNAPAESVVGLKSMYARHTFMETKPISTYLFAFAAGPFIHREASYKVAGRPVRFYGRKTQEKLIDKHAAEIFSQHKQALDFLSEYFDERYGFLKFDFVCVPDFPFSGMEHPGCIFYGEDPMLFRSEVTKLREARRADLIAHEVAHQWFGDLVTMPWFNDVWLKEGFATFMAHKCLESYFTGIDHELNFYLRNIPSALDTDTTSGATPIRQHLANMNDAKSNYGPIIYRKGPAVLRALEAMIGTDAFQSGVRTFLNENRYASASWDSFLATFEKTWGKDPGSLSAYSSAWIENAGVPRVRAELIGPRNNAKKLRIVQEDPLNTGRMWPIALEATVLTNKRGASAKYRSNFDSMAVGMESLPVGSRFAFPDTTGDTYALFDLDEASLDYALQYLGSIDSPLLRAKVWEAIWYKVQLAEMAPRDYAFFALANVEAESDLRLVSSIFGHLGVAINRYLSGEKQELVARRFEMALLRIANDEAASRDRRILAFRTYLSQARTEAGLNELLALFEMKTLPAGPEISKRDRWQMVTQLMMFGRSEAEAMLQKMVAADPGDEGRRRAFMVECARPNMAVKRKLFARFHNDPDLPERWVQDGCAVFFASGQAGLTDEFLAAALEKLPWVKKNRKIFFLSAWVEAAVRSRLNASSIEVVEEYLRTKPDRDIEMKTRVPLDHLRRTVVIRARHP